MITVDKSITVLKMVDAHNPLVANAKRQAIASLEAWQKELADSEEIRKKVIDNPKISDDDKYLRLAMLDYHKMRCEIIVKGLEMGGELE